MIIKIRDLFKTYEGDVKILKGVNLDIEKGEVMAFGDNGKRKKTLFEKVTLVVVLIMLFVTLAGIFATALGAFSRF